MVTTFRGRGIERFTVTTGPKGGAEYRAWTGPDTFFTVGRHFAWPHLDPADREKAEAIVAGNKATARAKAEDDAAWSRIMRGR